MFNTIYVEDEILYNYYSCNSILLFKKGKQ